MQKSNHYVIDELYFYDEYGLFKNGFFPASQRDASILRRLSVHLSGMRKNLGGICFLPGYASLQDAGKTKKPRLRQFKGLVLLNAWSKKSLSYIS